MFVSCLISQSSRGDASVDQAICHKYSSHLSSGYLKIMNLTFHTYSKSTDKQLL